MRTTPFIFLFALIFFAGTLDLKAQKNTESSVPPVKFCDLIKRSHDLAGKEVSVEATYRVFFESSQLYCLSCPDALVWVEFDMDENEWNKASKRFEKVKSPGKTYNVVFEGILHPESAGHFGIYDYRFVVTSVRKLEIVDKIGSSPGDLSPESRKKVCQ